MGSAPSSQRPPTGVGPEARPAPGHRRERKAKEAAFDCRMCGQCILHSTGLTCPMRCPKELRNGPCGGVRRDGSCEVYPDRPCVWALAWRRSQRLPLWRSDIHHVQPRRPPVGGTSSWASFVTGRDRIVPDGWTR
ncbi:MAG: methylenetetrahydrofolate reductase C-terminal domain-containing protein [Actinomycetota bacterium]